MNNQYRLAECVKPYGSLVSTKLPGARNHMMNYNIQQVKVYRLQQKMRTQEEKLNLCVSMIACLSIDLLLT